VAGLHIAVLALLLPLGLLTEAPPVYPAWQEIEPTGRAEGQGGVGGMESSELGGRTGDIPNIKESLGPRGPTISFPGGPSEGGQKQTIGPSSGIQVRQGSDEKLPRSNIPEGTGPHQYIGPSGGTATQPRGPYVGPREEGTPIRSGGWIPSGQVPATERRSSLEDLATSPWFAVITGFASLAGALLALYQLRVKYQPYSKYRTMEWEKILLVSVGVGLITFAGMRFYNQNPPPGNFLLREIYDSIHGTEGSYWPLGEYVYPSAIFERSGYAIHIKQINLMTDFTEVHFRADPVHGSSSQSDFEPFPNAVIGTSQDIRYHPLDRSIRKGGKAIFGYLRFPRLAARSGSIMIWDDGDKLSKTEDITPAMRFTNDDRGEGDSIWGLLFILGIIIFVTGVFYHPFNSVKRKLLEQGEELRRERQRELKKLLGGRTYEELPSHEKQEYDQTAKYYDSIQNKIFKMLTGDSGESPKDNA
jgi:hypothetical protein